MGQRDSASLHTTPPCVVGDGFILCTHNTEGQDKASQDKHLSRDYHFIYCKFGNFRENLIFVNSVKKHFCDIKIRDKGVIYLYQKTIE